MRKRVGEWVGLMNDRIDYDISIHKQGAPGTFNGIEGLSMWVYKLRRSKGKEVL